MHPGLVHSPSPPPAPARDQPTLGPPRPRRFDGHHNAHCRRHTGPASPACLPDNAPTQAELPDPSAWAATLARAIVEVVTGARQAPQLRRWLLPDLYTALTNIHLSPCARGASAIHVRVCSIDAQHTEAAVIVATAARIYALALRLEEYRGRWMATALELA